MQRWNGWGDASIDYPLPETARLYLQEALGSGPTLHDAKLGETLVQLQTSTWTKPVSGISTDAESRLRCSYGQSLPDWLQRRFGQCQYATDAVAAPESETELRELIAIAQQRNARVIPFGGGTSVAGHFAPADDSRPSLTIDLRKRCRLLEFRAEDRLALVEAGCSGPLLEAQLARHGYTLGHFPQSFEYSTIGGWIATRSSGQQSYLYGRIEQLFAGGAAITAEHDIECQPFPASSAGPDLKHLLLGSEGRLGIIHQAWLRVRPKPESEKFLALFFPDWQQAITGARLLAQSDLPFSMLRLSNSQETDISLRMAGHTRAIHYLRKFLRWRLGSNQPCLMLLGLTGEAKQVRSMQTQALTMLKPLSVQNTGETIGQAWRKNRFRNVYLRNTLWSLGYAIDTVETALPWSQVTSAMQAIEQVARDQFAAEQERVLAYSHLSHVYASGCSVYSTFVFRLSEDYQHNLARWRKLKTAITDTIQVHGGTLSHQHGVGKDHLPWLSKELGEGGSQLLHDIIKAGDPNGLFANGNLI